MLHIKQLALPENLLLIEEEPIFIDTNLSTNIQKTAAQIEEDKAKRRFRTGKVIAIGKTVIDNNSSSFYSTKGKLLDISIGTILLYDAFSVTPNDIPLDYEEKPKTLRRLIYMNRNFAQAIIEDEQSPS